MRPTGLHSMRSSGIRTWRCTEVSKIKTPTTNKRPAAQIDPAKKAAEMKAAADKKQPQPPWLQRPIPALESVQPPAPERLNAGNQSQAPPRLLDKTQVCIIAN